MGLEQVRTDAASARARRDAVRYWLGGAGLVGFPALGVAFAARWVDEATYVFGSTLALAFLGVALLLPDTAVAVYERSPRGRGQGAAALH